MTGVKYPLVSQTTTSNPARATFTRKRVTQMDGPASVDPIVLVRPSKEPTKENSMTSNIPVPDNAVVADPARPWKAIVAGAVSFLGLLWAALAGRDNWGNMSVQEWVAIIVPTILTFAATYAVPNPKVLRASLNRRNESGYGAVELLVVVILVVILIVVLLRVL